MRGVYERSVREECIGVSEERLRGVYKRRVCPVCEGRGGEGKF
jgi:hypothetical protein